MSTYGTWPPTMGHSVIIVEVVAGTVNVTVGRVTGYVHRATATGEFRSVSLRLADGSVATSESIDEVFDLDAGYSYGMSEAAVGAVRDAIAAMALALLPPKAAAPVDPVAVPADESVAVEPVAKGGE